MANEATRALLHRRIAVAEEICAFASSLVVQANVALRERAIRLRNKDRLLVGLALKIDNAYRALIEDCKAERSEAMHHLKTMAECMIYFYAVAQDPSDGMERRVLAKAFHEEAKFFKDNPGETDPSEISEIEAVRARLLAGPPKVKPLPDLATLAKSLEGVTSWYSRVYRMACEPAHIGDVIEFIPQEDEAIGTGPAGDFALFGAKDALWYGSHIVLSIMRTVCESTDLGLQAPFDVLESRLGDGGGPVNSEPK